MWKKTTMSNSNKKKHVNTMQRQVFLFTTALSLVIFLTLLIVLISMFYKAIKLSYAEGMSTDADIIADIYSSYDVDRPEMRNVLRTMANEISADIALVDNTGESIAMEYSVAPDYGKAMTIAKEVYDSGETYSDYSFWGLMKSKRMVYARPIVDMKGRVVAAFAIDYYLEGVVGAVRLTLIIVLVFAVLTTAVIVTGGSWFSRKVTMNLNKVAAAAGKISEGDYSVRLQISSNDEFRLLANSFNHLAARVESNIAEISEQNARLADVAARQAAFTSNASHELKTPLTGIIGNAEVILKYADNLEDAKMLARNIHDDALRLSAMTKNLLDLARMENIEYQENIVWKDADVSIIMSEAVALCRIRITENNQQLEMIMPDNICITTEPDLLRQVFVNLVDNAAKYSPPGSKITIAAGNADNGVKITVADNGTGIAEHDLQRIFDRFYRVNKARARAVGGTGLGLAITKQIVDILTGKISVASRIGEGTVFTVWLPKRPQEHKE